MMADIVVRVVLVVDAVFIPYCWLLVITVVVETMLNVVVGGLDTAAGCVVALYIFVNVFIVVFFFCLPQLFLWGSPFFF